MVPPNGDETVPLIPAYGAASLADLPASSLAALGAGGPNPLGLAPARRVCVFLVDGLGERLLRAHADLAPFLSAQPGRVLTAGFPATTSTSLGTLGTGTGARRARHARPALAVPGEGRMLQLPALDHHAGRRSTRTRGSPRRPSTSGPRPPGAAGLRRPGHVRAHRAHPGGVPRRALRRRRHRRRPGRARPGGRSPPSAPTSSSTTATSTCRATVHGLGHPASGASSSRSSTAWPSGSPRRCPPGSALYVTADHGMVNVTDRVDFDLVARAARGRARCSAATAGPATSTPRRAPPRRCSTTWRAMLRRPGLGGHPGGGGRVRLVRAAGPAPEWLRPDRRRARRAVRRLRGDRLRSRSRSSPRSSAVTARSPPPSSTSRCWR